MFCLKNISIDKVKLYPGCVYQKEQAEVSMVEQNQMLSSNQHTQPIEHVGLIHIGSKVIKKY